METATRTGAIVESYLREMSVRPIYADQMFSIPKEQVYWIPTTQFRSDFAGLLPELKDRANRGFSKFRDVSDFVGAPDTRRRATTESPIYTGKLRVPPRE
jgi:hypothetical protein